MPRSESLPIEFSLSSPVCANDCINRPPRVATAERLSVTAWQEDGNEEVSVVMNSYRFATQVGRRTANRHHPSHYTLILLCKIPERTFELHIRIGIIPFHPNR